jgi:two-component system phosphate regulon response regulator OmpR
MVEPLPPVNPSAPHLLVVDDDRRLRDLLRRFLRESGFVVSTAESAAEARGRLETFTFDLIVLDVMMKGETGLSFLSALRSEGNATPVLMLTARGEAEDRIKGLEAGADDYLPKPFEPKELVLRINAILRRRPQESPPAPLRLGRWLFDPARDELTDGSEIIRLSSVEAGLLRALAEKPGSILSRDDLLTRQPAAGNARTIDVQVTRLRRKIETDPKQPRYLVTVRGEGYALRPDP